MKKALKIILSSVSGLVIFIIMLPILLSMILQISAVQNFVVAQISAKLSQVASTKISISHVDIEFFTKAVLSDVYIEDQRGDTMIYAKNLKVAINGINFLTGKISLGSTTLSGGKVYLYKDSLGVMNIKQVFDNFKPKVPPPNPPNFRLTATELNLLHTRFKMDEYGAPKQDYGVNFKAMEFSDINFQAHDLNVFNYNVWLSIEHISLRERSGFYLQHLSSERCGVDSSGMYYADVTIETPNSTMALDSLNFITANRSWWDWNDFTNKMILSARIKPSKISSVSLGYFIRKQLPSEVVAEIKGGTLRGPVSDMRGRINELRTDGMSLTAAYSIKGLPKIDSTVFRLAVEPLQLSAGAANGLFHSFTGDSLSDGTAAILTRLGDITLRASFGGTLRNFHALADMTSSCGHVNSTFDMRPSAAGASLMKAVVTTTNFQAGRAFGIAKMGAVSLNAMAGIHLDSRSRLTLNTQTEISRLQYGTYNFKDIKIDGAISGRQFTGLVAASDKNLRFEAKGRIDLTGNIPDYDVDVELGFADLAAIGLNRRDSISTLSASLTAKASGRTLDELNGTARIDKILYVNHLDTVRAAAITITSAATETLKQIDIRSGFADISLRGRNSFLEVTRYLSQSLERFMPSFPDATAIMTGSKGSTAGEKLSNKKTGVLFSDGYYQFTVNVKQANNVAGIFLPGLEISEGSTLNFFFNPYLDQLNIRLKSALIERQGFTAENLNLDSRNHGDSLSLFLTSDFLSVAGIDMPDMSILGDVCHNVINLGGRFNNRADTTSVLLNTTTSFTRTVGGMAQMCINIHPTAIILSGTQWNMRQSRVLMDTTGIEVHNVGLYSGAQRLDINGRMSGSLRDTVSVDLKNFDIAPASMFISSLGYKLRGSVGGVVKVVAPFSTMRFFAAIDFKNIYLNNYSLGNPMLRSTLDDQKKRIDLSLGEDLLSAPVKGYYDIVHKRYGASFRFPHFDMVLLEPLLAGVLTATRGEADVDLTLSGGAGTPKLEGEIEVKKYSAMVDYTRARYDLSGHVTVRDNCFTLPSTPITDGGLGKGEISAQLNSHFFRDLTFDIKASFTDLLALNTTKRDNSSFYGKAYGTGRLSIKGSEQKTNINISAATALSSEFVLPLSDVATIETASFIRFIDPTATPEDSLARRRKTSRQPSVRRGANELDLVINLQVLPNTLGLIEFNATMAQEIRGRGEGRLSMHINPTLDIFTINGPLQITEGSYKFSLPPFFKYFTIQSGGQLVWSGQPANPNIDLSAIYTVKTSLSPLGGTVSGQNTTANIDCGINLSGKLSAPDIKFSIDAPSADAETQNLLRNSINTEEGMATQFISLVLSKTLMPDMAAIGSMGTSFVGATGLEFLSNQLGQLISGDKVNVRFGYRPQSTSTSDEFYAGVGGDIIENILSVEVDGNYNTGNNPTYNARNPFTVDAYLVWKINKRGTLKLQGFTRTIDRFDETQGLQESGIGIYFKQDFSDWKDLKRRLKDYKIQRMEKKKK